MVNLDPTYWPAPSWLVNSVGRALHWYCRGHGFKSRTGLKFFSGPIFNYYFSSVVSCEDLLNSSKCVTTISLTVNLVKFRANWHKHDKVDKVVRKHSYCAFYRVSNCSRDEETSHTNLLQDQRKKKLYFVPFFSDLPAYGCVQSPLFVSYLVRNRTLQGPTNVFIKVRNFFMSKKWKMQIFCNALAEHRITLNLVGFIYQHNHQKMFLRSNSVH